MAFERKFVMVLLRKMFGMGGTVVEVQERQEAHSRVGLTVLAVVFEQEGHLGQIFQKWRRSYRG